MVSGEGVGVVVLKRLSDAHDDGDNILAVIRGFAVNNDGSNKIGYTAPGIEGQAEVIALAQSLAEADPESISYVEAHGTATPLGDPIEIAALAKAFSAGGTGARGYCAIGSVKTNIGHLDAAAGVAGLIKTVLALQHRQIPPSLHFTRPNPQIDFASSPFFVNAKLSEWPSRSLPRRAGVSSFGIGGTNAHVVLEEAPEQDSTAWPCGPELLVLSAKSAAALGELASRLAAWLRDHPQASLAAVAYSLQTGRRPLPHRRILICRDLAEAGVLLSRNLTDAMPQTVAPEHQLRVRLLTEAGRRFLADGQVDWAELWPDGHPRRIVLPTYPFQRQRFWVEPAHAHSQPTELVLKLPPASVLEDLRSLLHELSGVPKEEIVETASFNDLGFDSLLLTQISLAAESRFGVSTSMRQLQEDLASLGKLAGYLSARRTALPVAAAPTAESVSHGPFQQPALGNVSPLAAEEQKHIKDLTARYTVRTARSKQLATAHRSHFADPRAVAGFRAGWKEMLYPLVVERSSGSRLWDVDGNEYIDLLMGFGVNLFGHSPEFVVRAIEEQLRQGVEIGPQSALAGSVAERICVMTGHQRATFCNTGSEAVLAALRVARTVTNRQKIALFAGSYHGMFDEVLVRASSSGQTHATPVAPGIPPGMAANVLVLEYGSDEALEIIRKNAGQLAAVLVEPVQSRNPSVQPVAFLRALRRITAEQDIALIFDEVLSGFRAHPGGVQALFGVHGDLATYGKIVGGGMPVGVVAGSARFMDALDGGAWQYGDDSRPEKRVTYFAGTFVRHPLAMAAANAVLDHLEQQGPALQSHLNDRTSLLAQELKARVDRAGLPLTVGHFSSQLFFRPEASNSMASLLFYHLRARGVHLWEGRPAFLSTAHSEEDVARVLDAFQDSIKELPGTRPHQQAAISAAPRKFLSMPLSAAQTDLWIATQMSREASCSYNLTYLLRMRGPLQCEVLESSLAELLDRHESLRTTFAANGEEQRIWTSMRFDLKREDASVSCADPERRLAEIAQRDGGTPFDLENGPLVRALLVKLADRDHALLLTVHHLVSDGQSFNLLLGELGKLYSAGVTGSRAQLPEPMSNRAYLLRRADRMFGTEAAEIENYWLDRLADPPVPFDLPSDHVRPVLKTYSATTERLALDETTTAQWRRASARSGSNLFSFLLAGFSVLLHRLSGANDLVIGIPAADQSTTAGLRAKGDRHLVGDYVNLLPIRIECDPASRFSEHLGRLRRLLIDGYENQNFMFGELLSKLKLPRDPGRAPLVPVVFNVDREAHGVSLAGLTVEMSSPPKAFDFFDLRLNVTDTGGRLFADLTFNVDLFDRETVRCWLTYWKTLLDAVGSDGTLASLPLLDREQQKQIAQDWNQTARAIPSGSVSQWFEEHAKQTPQAIAAEDDQGRLTYGELLERVDCLARRLASKGAGADLPVAIYMERSLDMLTAMLAVLKSGSAYLPLDPAYPEARLRLMVEGSGARIVLRNASTSKGLLFPGVETVHTGEGSGGDDFPNSPREWPASRPTDLAYILYTSGSSGTPKGVGVSHAALSNLIAAMREEIRVSDQDALMAVSPLTFDIATLEFLLPVVSGARVVIASRETASDGRLLLEALRTRRATILQATPATWRMLIDVGWDGQPHLKVLCGGEAMSPQLAGQLMERSDAVWNLYGPTEATIWALGHALHASVPSSKLPARSSVAIGRPLANMQAYVLDTLFQLVPPGVIGEIFLGGTSLARGYIARPDLDRERFLGLEVNGLQLRLYRTGDLGRFRSDGVLEYIGREDGQVKLRGFRVELGEISSLLMEHPDIVTATAAFHAHEEGGAITAYFVVKPDRAPTVEALRTWLAGRLPGYMIPAVFVRIDAVPLTPHGKIDVHGLLRVQPSQEEPPAGAWDVTEYRLLKLWEELFGSHLFTAGNGSTTKSFFDVGGDSLLAVRFLSRVERTFGVRVTLRELFEAPTIQRLAARLREPGSTPMPSSVVVFQPSGSQTPLFFVDVSPILLPLIAGLGVDRPVVGISSLKENVRMDATVEVSNIAGALVESILSFRPSGPYALAGFCAAGLIAYEVAQQLRRLGQEVEFVVLLDVVNPESSHEQGQPLPKKLRYHLRQLRELSNVQRLQYLRERVQNLVSLGKLAAWAFQADLALKTKRDPNTPSCYQRAAAVIKAVNRYKPAPYDGSGLLIRCERHRDADYGWSALLGEAFETLEVRGGHDTMLKEPHLKEVIAAIDVSLKSARGRDLTVSSRRPPRTVGLTDLAAASKR